MAQAGRGNYLSFSVSFCLRTGHGDTDITEYQNLYHDPWLILKRLTNEGTSKTKDPLNPILVHNQ